MYNPPLGVMITEFSRGKKPFFNPFLSCCYTVTLVPYNLKSDLEAEDVQGFFCEVVIRTCWPNQNLDFEARFISPKLKNMKVAGYIQIIKWERSGDTGKTGKKSCASPWFEFSYWYPDDVPSLLVFVQRKTEQS